MVHILVNNLINEMANGGALVEGVGMMTDCTVSGRHVLKRDSL